MYKALSIILVFLSLSSYGQDFTSRKQKSNQEEKVYLKEVQAFIRYIHKDRLKDSTYVLLNEPQIEVSCEKQLAFDSLFSVTEKNNLSEQLRSQRIKSWKEVWPYRIKFISSRDLRESYKLNNAFNWIAFKENISSSYYIISSPVFFENYQLCIYYEANYSDSAETGVAKLYKKVRNNWVFEKSVCSWLHSWDTN